MSLRLVLPLFLLLAALVLPGMLLVAAILPPGAKRAGRWLDLLAFGPFFGLGLTTILDLALRLTLDRGLDALDQTVLMLAALALALATRRSRSRTTTTPDVGSDPWLRTTTLVLLGAALGFLIPVLAAHFAAAPDGGWDGIAVWGLLGRTLFASAGHPGLALHQIQVTQTEYPAFLPASLAILHRAVGFDSALPGQVMGVLGFTSLVLTVHRLLDRLSGTLAAHLGALLLVTTPIFFVNALDQYADTILAAENLAAVGFIALALTREEGRRRYLLLGGFFLGLLCWTKGEGPILALVVLVASVFALRFGRSLVGAFRSAALLAVGAVPGALARLVWWWEVAPRDRRLGQAASSDLGRLLDLDRWRAALSAFGREISTRGEVLCWNAPVDFNQSLQRWSYYWLAVLFLGLLGLGFPGRAGRFVLSAAVLQLLAYAAVFVLIPGDQAWQLDNAAHRLLMHLAPLCLLSCLHLPESAHRSAQAQEATP